MEAVKLSAPRLLRVQKIIDHVESKLREALEEASASASASAPDDVVAIEIVCNDEVLPPHTNLGAWLAASAHTHGLNMPLADMIQLDVPPLTALLKSDADTTALCRTALCPAMLPNEC